MKRARLRGKDKVKYQIHAAVKAAIPRCNSWADLCDRLAGQGVGVRFKYDKSKGEIVGVSFTKDGISFSGSRIDRSMGFYKLDKQLGNRIADGMKWQPRLPDNGVDERLQPTRQDVATGNHAAHTLIEQPTPIGAETDGSGDSPVESSSDIVQVTITALIELCVQPHQPKVSSGGGGGGNESSWGESDNEKDKLKPRRRRR